jgi:hypothetical protein
METERRHMEDSKHKVTLYLPPELHRQLKIKAAVEEQPMSVLAERALQFLLSHPEAVEAAYGRSHRVYHCPECQAPLVMRSDTLEALPRTKAILSDPPLDEGAGEEREELVSLVG